MHMRGPRISSCNRCLCLRALHYCTLGSICRHRSFLYGRQNSFKGLSNQQAARPQCSDQWPTIPPTTRRPRTDRCSRAHAVRTRKTIILMLLLLLLLMLWYNRERNTRLQPYLYASRYAQT